MHELKKFNDQLFKNVISNPTEQELRNLAKQWIHILPLSLFLLKFFSSFAYFPPILLFIS